MKIEVKNKGSVYEEEVTIKNDRVELCSYYGGGYCEVSVGYQTIGMTGEAFKELAEAIAALNSTREEN